MDTTVSLARCKDYSPENLSRALDEALAPLGGLEWVKPGMKIAVKANLLTARRPDSAAVTHPALLLALCEKLIARGASVVVGDSPGGPYTPAYVNTVYSVAGLHALRACGAKLNADFSEKDVAFPEAVAAKQFRCTAYLLDADAIIDVCKLKTHGMMTYTGAVKNFFGAIPGLLKPEYHYLYPDHDRFADMLVDLCEYFKPTLSITDAVVGMEGNGPSNGTPRKLELIAAARNPHALDMACAHIIGLAPKDVPTLRAAQRRGLIPEDISGLTVNGNLEEFLAKDFKIGSGRLVVFSGRVSGALLRRMFSAWPEPEAESCTGCAECARRCPADAIAMREKLPEIRRGKCIRCFCCQEFCPTGAMKAKRPLLARLLSR